MGRTKKIIEEPIELFDVEESTPKKKPGRVENLGKKPKVIKNARDKITRSQAIKFQCIECMGYQKALVKDCTDFGCPLWPYRKGYGQEHTDLPMRGDKPKDELSSSRKSKSRK